MSRSPSNKSVDWHNANAFVADVRELLDRSFTKTANLRAKIGSGRDARESRLEARKLERSTATALAEFDRRVEKAAPEVAEHSLVRDVRRALVGLKADLEELQGSPESGDGGRS